MSSVIDAKQLSDHDYRLSLKGRKCIVELPDGKLVEARIFAVMYSRKQNKGWVAGVLPQGSHMRVLTVDKIALD